MGQMLHKIRKQVNNAVSLVTKIIFKDKFDKYKSLANVRFGVRYTFQMIIMIKENK